MNHYLNDCNAVTLEGTLADDLRYSHNIFGEDIYSGILLVPRKSGVIDTLNISVPSATMEALPPHHAGWHVAFLGQLRTHRLRTEAGNRLIVYAFVREWTNCFDPAQAHNAVTLRGTICKAPAYRFTPFGRKITEVMLAINRPYGQSDYVPCITWGKDAEFVNTLKVGDYINLEGRVQSREYDKRLPDGRVEKRMTWEVSASSVSRVPGTEHWKAVQ